MIGFDGSYLSEDKTTPKQWIDRKAWPVWAKKAVIARDRGTCSICKKNLMQELDEDENIDHIIPLAKGGNNDLLNLQLLCSKCNNKKRDLIYETKSSIPPYILRKTRKKS